MKECRYKTYDISDLARMGNVKDVGERKKALLIDAMEKMQKQLHRRIQAIGQASMLFCKEDIGYAHQELETAQAALASAILWIEQGIEALEIA